MSKEFESYIKIIDNKISYVFKTLFVEITDRCNYQCKHCYNSSGRDSVASMDFENFKNVITEFVENGVEEIVLSGGEALLHESIWEMLDFLRRLNIKTTLLTNGKLLLKNTIEKLKHFNINIQLSLDGATPKSNDFIRQPGSFSDVIRALTELEKLQYMDNVSINSVISRINITEIHEIINICEKFSVPVIGFSFLNNMGRAENSELTPSIPEISQALNVINTYKSHTNISVRKIDVSKKCRFCEISSSIFLTPVVDVYGNIYMCEFLRKNIFSIGNIFQHTLSEILSGTKIRNNMLFINIRKSFIPSCKGCFAQSRCEAGCIVQCNNSNYFEPAFCDVIRRNFIQELGV